MSSLCAMLMSGAVLGLHCPHSHPLEACGRCWTDTVQAQSGGCLVITPNPTGCPESHPVRGCGRCWTGAAQALSGYCRNVVAARELPTTCRLGPFASYWSAACCRHVREGYGKCVSHNCYLQWRGAYRRSLCYRPSTPVPTPQPTPVPTPQPTPVPTPVPSTPVPPETCETSITVFSWASECCEQFSGCASPEGIDQCVQDSCSKWQGSAASSVCSSFVPPGCTVETPAPENPTCDSLDSIAWATECCEQFSGCASPEGTDQCVQASCSKWQGSAASSVCSSFVPPGCAVETPVPENPTCDSLDAIAWATECCDQFSGCTSPEGTDRCVQKNCAAWQGSADSSTCSNFVPSGCSAQSAQSASIQVPPPTAKPVFSFPKRALSAVVWSILCCEPVRRCAQYDRCVAEHYGQHWRGTPDASKCSHFDC